MCSNSEWTNNEASRTKLSLINLGYIEDRFMKHLCGGNPLKRTPEIHRGYFSRVYSIAHSVRRFCLEEGASAQIVNIGAGFDSLFWRLQTDEQISFSRFVDVDCLEVIQQKIRSIQNNEELLSLCGKTQQVGTSFLLADKYSAIGQDATKPLQLIDKLIKKCNINKNEPILFIFECVLLYWTEEASTNVIYSLNKSFPKCNFIVFDLVNTEDKFSQVMQQSLIDRDTPLYGTASTRTLQDWKTKFLKNGSNNVNSWLMKDVYDKLIDKKELDRIEKIEFLDEIELLIQLFNHYCLVLASNYKIYDW